VAQYVPVIVYIVALVDVPAGCTLIEYPSAGWGFTSPRTGAIGRWLRGHGAKKIAANTRPGNEQKTSAFARAIALSLAVFPNGRDMGRELIEPRFLEERKEEDERIAPA